uniref:Uncharacterized protein n=1 Tax=Oryza sativa subsp. japonica TaxID=39947 RepID=Q6K3X7_ORYSJ|nr:hypothetical protein [Oryza sativa Japonica Group]
MAPMDADKRDLVADLDEFVLKEEDYHIVDYMLVIYAAKYYTCVIQMNKEQHRLRPTGVGLLPVR